ncbi:caspase family protein [Amycolatopsis sp. NPDC024027]|uniref:caspase family protein n=1 Tax=Amycolatopsis sp. NPDC024027 TaxID=3154327 RepID=UPI0033CC92D5
MARRCLIIANQYYQDPDFAELPGATEDAIALSEVLAQSDIGGFDVTVVRDRGVTHIRRSIEFFFQHAERDDLLWLHLSCHGMKNRDNRLFLVTTDTERDYLASTGIDSTFISDQVESSLSRQVVVFLDCCYSGAYSRGLRTRSADDSVDVAEAFSGKGRVVITASNALQFSHETMATSRDAAAPSIFTRAIVTGLATGAADLDLDGRITAEELYDYVYREVRAQLPNQTPTRSVSSAEGTILLALNARVGASQLPAELVKTSLSPLGWQRIGVLHELENLLGSHREDIRDAAQDLLAQLIADPDMTVAAQARTLWSGRGLGELSAARGTRASPARARSAENGLGSAPDCDDQRTDADHTRTSDSAETVRTAPTWTATLGELGHKLRITGTMRGNRLRRLARKGEAASLPHRWYIGTGVWVAVMVMVFVLLVCLRSDVASTAVRSAGDGTVPHANSGTSASPSSSSSPPPTMSGTSSTSGSDVPLRLLPLQDGATVASTISLQSTTVPAENGVSLKAVAAGLAPEHSVLAGVLQPDRSHCSTMKAVVHVTNPSSGTRDTTVPLDSGPVRLGPAGMRIAVTSGDVISITVYASVWSHFTFNGGPIQAACYSGVLKLTDLGTTPA